VKKSASALNMLVVSTLVFGFTSVLSGCSSKQSPTEPTPKTAALRAAPVPLAGSIASQGYLYGYPLVLMDATRQYATGPQRVCESASEINQFQHLLSPPDPSFKAVVRPNVDTLYSIAFLDLSEGPVQLYMPAVQNRFTLMGLYDAYSNNFAGLGTQLHGENEALYSIYGPDHKHLVDSSSPTDVESPTNLVWVIGRTEMKDSTDANDIAKVNAIQQQYQLIPPNPVVARPTVDCIPRDSVNAPLPPDQFVNSLQAPEFFSLLNTLMAESPPPERDNGIVRRLARIGVGPKARKSVDNASAWEKRKLSRGKTAAEQLLNVSVAFSEAGNFGAVPQAIKLGEYDTNYYVRATVAIVGFGANRKEFAMYQNTKSDSEGDALDGSQAYRLTFPADALPPVDAFWSITLYDSDGFLVENELNRYALGSNTGLEPNNDGSLTLHFGPAAPADLPISNWLPSAPAEPFKLTLRLYAPREEATSGDWAAPQVQPY